MIELFTDVPEYAKQQSKFWVDLALQQQDAADGIRMLEEYRKSCLNDKEREFLDFYLGLEIEKRQMKNN